VEGVETHRMATAAFFHGPYRALGTGARGARRLPRGAAVAEEEVGVVVVGCLACCRGRVPWRC
jgi:hypothetical protein